MLFRSRGHRRCDGVLERGAAHGALDSTDVDRSGTDHGGDGALHVPGGEGGVAVDADDDLATVAELCRRLVRQYREAKQQFTGAGARGIAA